MNERIKELAEQANCSIDGMGYGEGNIENFAVLIVRECAKIAQETSSNQHLWILKHFNVNIKKF